jgi:hypothetical protein
MLARQHRHPRTPPRQCRNRARVPEVPFLFFFLFILAAYTKQRAGTETRETGLSCKRDWSLLADTETRETGLS